MLGAVACEVILDQNGSGVFGGLAKALLGVVDCQTKYACTCADFQERSPVCFALVARGEQNGAILDFFGRFVRVSPFAREVDRTLDGQRALDEIMSCGGVNGAAALAVNMVDGTLERLGVIGGAVSGRAEVHDVGGIDKNVLIVAGIGGSVARGDHARHTQILA